MFAGDLPPEAFRRGPPYASAAFLGATLYVSLVQGLHVPRGVAQISAVVLVCAIRWVAIWRGWLSPGPCDLRQRMWGAHRDGRGRAPEEEDGPGRAADGA